MSLNELYKDERVKNNGENECKMIIKKVYEKGGIASALCVRFIDFFFIFLVLFIHNREARACVDILWSLA